MKTKSTVKGSPCKKKLFDSLVGKDDSEIDPSYKLFLENLTLDGNTYVLHVPNGDNGTPVFIRYEEDDTSYRNVEDENGPYFPNSSLGTSPGAPNGHRLGETSSQAASGNVGQSFSPRKAAVKKKEISTVDESYELFLSLVKFKDGYMVIEPEPGLTIVYEKEVDMPARYDEPRAGSSTNELEPLISPSGNMEEVYATRAREDGLAQADKITSEDEMAGPSSEDLDGQNVIRTDEHGLHAGPSDLNACKDDQQAPLAFIYGGSSTFDEKLNAVLSRPYDQHEYEELWRKATDRKPVMRQRHLRSITKHYATVATGLSYLDHYPDLALQIDSADSDERLGLLRKFFFWLENLCLEDAYMPWISQPQAFDLT